MIKTILIFLISLSYSLNIIAQDNINKYTVVSGDNLITSLGQTATTLYSLSAIELSSLTLPSLDILILNGSSENPYVSKSSADADEYIYNLKIYDRSWFEYIRGTAQYVYGNVISYNYEGNSNTGNIMDRYKSNVQGNWSAGGVISLPLERIFSNNLYRKRLKSRIESANMQRQMAVEVVVGEIIDAYTNANLAKESLIKYYEGYALAQAEYDAAKKEFINGEKEIKDLSEYINIVSKTKVEYENMRNSLIKNILILQKVSHTKIF